MFSIELEVIHLLHTFTQCSYLYFFLNMFECVKGNSTFNILWKIIKWCIIQYSTKQSPKSLQKILFLLRHFQFVRKTGKIFISHRH